MLVIELNNSPEINELIPSLQEQFNQQNSKLIFGKEFLFHIDFDLFKDEDLGDSLAF